VLLERMSWCAKSPDLTCPGFHEHFTRKQFPKKYPTAGKQSGTVNRERQQRRFAREFKMEAIRFSG